jgi:regulator of PEP synthase PpsR (kinase-PPPase family)
MINRADDRINIAIDYALRHDDGQMVNDLECADIILIGPSRTSKTPTSLYLACNGFKTANIPYVQGCILPNNLIELTKPLIIGLVISPTRLVEIRETRMMLLQINNDTNYTDLNIIKDECLQIKRICEKHKWQVIDVSRRSIEETAALISKIYYTRIL